MTHNSLSIRCAAAATFLAMFGCAQPSAPAAALPDVSPDGLQAVDARNLEAAYVRPGVDFSAYRQVLPGGLELAFRTPDPDQRQTALSEAQKTQFRQLLIDAFTAEFSSDDAMPLADGPGPDVLTLHARVQDISARVSSTGSGPGRAAILLDAVGEATLVLELRDSLSNEVLARGIDRQATKGTAILQQGAPVTKWSEVEALCNTWAAATRRALRSLTE